MLLISKGKNIYSGQLFGVKVLIWFLSFSYFFFLFIFYHRVSKYLEYGLDFFKAVDDGKLLIRKINDNINHCGMCVGGDICV